MDKSMVPRRGDIDGPGVVRGKRRRRTARVAASGLRFAAALAPLLFALAGCGGDVHFCSDLDPVPPNCEICNNGRDDDLDGDVDCDDSDCRHSAFCAGKGSAARTTSTTSASPAEPGEQDALTTTTTTR